MLGKSRPTYFLLFSFLPVQCSDLAKGPKAACFLPDKRCRVCNVPEVWRFHVAVELLDVAQQLPAAAVDRTMPSWQAAAVVGWTEQAEACPRRSSSRLRSRSSFCPSCWTIWKKYSDS